MATWSQARLAILVATGMVLLLAGVVAGSAVGTLIAPEPEGPPPLLIGDTNRADASSTQLITNDRRPSIRISQRGGGPAVRADSVNGPAGSFDTAHDSRNALYAVNSSGTVGTGSAITADGKATIGVRATSEGTIGLLARGPQVAVYADGQLTVDGDITLRGACLNCVPAALAVNASAIDLRRGEAVTIVGSERTDAGLAIAVAPAGPGDPVIGFVDTAVIIDTTRIYPDESVSYLAASNVAIAPGTSLRVLTGGLVDFALADDSGGAIEAGDSLVGSVTEGYLTRADALAEPGAAVGYAVGHIENGRIALFVAPH